MRVAFLDCFSGLSGDMFLGAAVDAGVAVEKLQSVAAALQLGATLTARPVLRAGIRSTQVEVLIHGHAEHEPEEPSHSHEHSHAHDGQAHSHAHAHDHGHTHEHEHQHSHEHAHEHKHEHVHRGLPEIRQVIAAAPVSEGAKAFALKTFTLLAQAEGKIHGRSPEEIHFHEVGSEDAIVDILCAAVAVEALGVERWYASALNTGSGTVRCAHGTLPVPAPATAELLLGAPVYAAGPQKELLTPTGAAILRALEVEFQPMPTARATATGYGAGGRDFPGHANVVRLTLAETAQAAEADTVAVLEANVDDMNPQIFGYVQHKLLEAGALDAFATAVQMKKGRPGLLITVLAPPEQEAALTRLLLAETTSLGVRRRLEQRTVLQRRHETVQSPWGPIRVKLGLSGGAVVNCAPEFEDCRAAAERAGVPLKTVMHEATRLYLSQAAEKSS